MMSLWVLSLFEIKRQNNPQSHTPLRYYEQSKTIHNHYHLIRHCERSEAIHTTQKSQYKNNRKEKEFIILLWYVVSQQHTKGLQIVSFTKSINYEFNFDSIKC